MTMTLHTWTSADKTALMALCNAVDRTFLSDRLPYPYTEADADWWLGMVAGNDGKEGVWRAIVVDGQVVGSISVERMARVSAQKRFGRSAVLLTGSWRWSASSARCSRRTWHRPGCWRRMGSCWRRPGPGPLNMFMYKFADSFHSTFIHFLRKMRNLPYFCMNY